MNKYESIIIVAQDVDEEGIKAIIARYTELINTERYSFKRKRDG